MARRYHSLLVREGGRWGIEYGSYDRSEMEEERGDMIDPLNVERRLARDVRIITTGETQAEIDAAVARLNAEGTRRANRLCDLAWKRWGVAYEAGLPSEPRLYRELCAAEREAARFDGVA